MDNLIPPEKYFEWYYSIRADRMAQVVEHLYCKHKDLSLNPSTKKKKKKTNLNNKGVISCTRLIEQHACFHNFSDHNMQYKSIRIALAQLWHWNVG
jgi:hypothetical protein